MDSQCNASLAVKMAVYWVARRGICWVAQMAATTAALRAVCWVEQWVSQRVASKVYGWVVSTAGQTVYIPAEQMAENLAETTAAYWVE